MTQVKEKTNEPEWLFDKRKQAFESYVSAPLPDRVAHLWKYTDPTVFLSEINQGKTNKSNIQFLISDEALNQGVVLLEINSAIKEKNDLVEKYFDKVACGEDKINLLNQALWGTGYFLYIPKGVKVEKPIVIKVSADLLGFEARRVVIALEEGASVSLIEEDLSSDSDTSLNICTEIFLEKKSKLNYLNINLTGKETVTHLLQRADFNEDSEFTNLLVSLGGRIFKADISSALRGEKAKSHTYGIVVGDGRQHFDHHVKLNHEGSFTESSLNFRVALKNKAMSAYTGNLKITHEALKCSAIQENRNLLLSKDAKAESIPELEILTNDVEKCSHGVTMGQVDKDQIYYLMSRGLTEKEAEKMIIEGFLEPTISRIPDETLREEVRLKVEQKLLTL